MDYFKTTRKVYNRLMDERSRKIYSNRIMYNLTKDDSFLCEMVSEYKPMCALIDFTERNKKKPLYIFGAGEWGEMIVKVIKEHLCKQYTR